MSSPTLPTASNARTKSTATKAAATAMNGRRKERQAAPGKLLKDQDVSAASEQSEPVSRAAYLTYFTLAVVAGATDLFTKQAVFRIFGFPGQQPTWWLIQDRLGIQTALNPGALFGMGGGKRLVFAALSVAALLGIITWLFVYK